MADATELWISGHLAEKIRAHGAETYPHECCGALLGRDSSPLLQTETGKPAREVLQLFPLVNRRDDSPRNRFSVTAEDVLAAEKAARGPEPRSRRLVSFASRPSGAAKRVRSGSRLAVVQLHHRQRAERGASGYDLLAFKRRSSGIFT